MTKEKITKARPKRTRSKVEEKPKSVSKKKGEVSLHSQLVRDGQVLKEFTSVTSTPTRVVEEVHAHVEVSAGVTVGMPNYSSIRTNVSLRLPCNINKEDIESTYSEAQAWVMEKEQELSTEMKEAFNG